MPPAVILPLLLRRLGRCDYLATWRAMQAFTDRRGDGDGDELWLAEHPPLFTQGLNGRAEHLHDPGAIPVVAVDRGGQVTYHGPGQLLLYPLLDLRRRRLGVRELVHTLEEATIAMLAGYGIAAAARPDAPGVYVAGRKLASLGLRVRRGCCYHGLALNVSVDLAPFRRIDPCGLAGIEMTRTADLGGPQTLEEAAAALLPLLAERLGYRLVEGLPEHL